MQVRLMAKAMIKDKQGNMLLLNHESGTNGNRRVQLFFPGGRVIDPGTGNRLRFEATHPTEIANIFAALFPKDGLASWIKKTGGGDSWIQALGRESGAKAIRRRVTHELRDVYGLLPNLQPTALRVEYNYPAFVRAETNARGQQTLYIYMMSRVGLDRANMRKIAAGLRQRPHLGKFVTLQETITGQTGSGLMISPNVYPVLQAIGLAPADELDPETAETPSGS